MKKVQIILLSFILLIGLSLSVIAVTFSHTFGSQGTGNGQFHLASDVAIDSNGNIYVADYGNNRIQKFSPDGTFIGTFGENAGLRNVQGLTIDLNDNIVATDYYSTSGTVVIIDSGDTVIATIGTFKYPADVSVDSNGYLFVVDSNNYEIDVYNSNYVYQYSFGSHGTGDGQFLSTYGPLRIAVDDQDNVYVSDSSNHRIQKFNNNGGFIGWFGKGTSTTGFHGPGSGETGQAGSGDGEFNHPWGMVIDSDRNIYIADTNNNRIQILDSNGNFLEKFGTLGTANGEFTSPLGLVLGKNNEIIVADTYNNRVQIFSAYLTPEPDVCVDAPSNMVSWWDADDVSGTTASDIQGGNDGTMTNGATTVPGKVGDAFSFDGINDYVVANAKLDTAEDYTIDFWIKPRFFRESPIPIIFRSGGVWTQNQFEFMIHLAGTQTWGAGKELIQFQVAYPTSSGNSAWVKLIGPAIPEDDWTHVASTYDANTLEVKLYVNGVLVDSKDVTQELANQGFTPGSSVTEEQFTFGADYWADRGEWFPAGQAFPGELDEIELFSRSLTPAEIQSIYDAGSAGKCKQEGPVCGNGVMETGEACDDGNLIDGDGCSSTCTLEDLDGDGYTINVDCDDSNADVNPGAAEVCGDGLDNNCDAIADEDLTQSTNELGACSVNTETCDAGVWLPNNEYTLIPEIVGNAVDDDCDGTAVCDSSAYWRNHGQFVSCVSKATGNENKEVSQAAQSNVGKKAKK